MGGGFGDSDHNPIVLEFAHGGDKPSSPFKFNEDWLKQPDFVKLIKDLWIPYGPTVHTTAAIQFVAYLNRATQAAKKWAHEKKLQDDLELKELEAAIETSLNDPTIAFSTQEDKEALVLLEKRRQALLVKREEAWRLKSKVIWLKSGDENTKFFQAYVRVGKAENTIWDMRNDANLKVSSFEGLANLGVEHFQSLYKAQVSSTLVEIIQLAQFFPSLQKKRKILISWERSRWRN